MKLTKEEMQEILNDITKELTEEALKEGTPTVAMAIMLFGVKFNGELIKKLFENEEEIEIIKE